MEKKFGTSVELEFIRVAKFNFNSVKSYADKSIAQLNEQDLHVSFGGETNTIAIIIQHISGNLVSRFSDFFTSDGEKANRNRDAEFEEQQLSKKELTEKWERAWKILFDLLDSISEEDLRTKIVFVRNEPHSLIEAFNRQIWHYGFHVGQIVSLAKQIKGNDWKNLSIAKGGSEAYNKQR